MDFVKKPLKSELSSRFFGCLKFAAGAENYGREIHGGPARMAGWAGEPPHVTLMICLHHCLGFCGGLSFEFHLQALLQAHTNRPVRILANDAFPPVIAFWQACKTQRDALCEALDTLCARGVSKEQSFALSVNTSSLPVGAHFARVQGEELRGAMRLRIEATEKRSDELAS